MGRLVRLALRRSLTGIRHVTPVRPNDAGGLVAEVYADVERDLGLLAPPVALHSPAPEVLAAAWCLLRETLVATGLADRAAKEAVAAAVSRSNRCPYCVDVHTATLRGLGGGTTGEDPLSAWADRTGRTRPFPVEQVPELLGVAVTFHHLNRMVNVFLGDSPLSDGVPAAARGGASLLLGRYLGSTARGNHVVGTSLRLLPPAESPPDLAWTSGNPLVADAFARAAAALDRAGARVLPADVRDLVLARLAAWDGTPTGIGRGWAYEAVGTLRAADRPAATLALLTALASHQVDDAVVAAAGLDDRSLVELTSWASFAAARRMAKLTHPVHRPTGS